MIDVSKTPIFISSDWHLHVGGKQDKIITEYLADEFLKRREEYPSLLFMCLGDVFDREESFNPRTVFLLNSLINKITDKYPDTKFYFLKGNHDALSSDRWDSLLNYLSPQKNIVLGRTFYIKDNLLHYSDGDVTDFYGDKGISTVFIHEDIVGAYFNSGNIKSSKGLSPEEISSNFPSVLSGHYHYPRIKIRGDVIDTGGVVYLGAVRQLRVQDAGNQNYYYVYNNSELKYYEIHSGCREFVRLETAEGEINESDVAGKVVYITEPCDVRKKEELLDKFKNLGAIDVSFKFVNVSGGSKLVESGVGEDSLPEYIVNDIIDSNDEYISNAGIKEKLLAKMGIKYLQGEKSDLSISDFIDGIYSKHKESIDE